MKGNLCEYCFDIIYICGFVQITTSLFSDWFWITLLVIPIFAFWKLWPILIKPFLFGGGDGNENDDKSESKLDKKKREKAERKANRIKYKPMKRR